MFVDSYGHLEFSQQHRIFSVQIYVSFVSLRESYQCLDRGVYTDQQHNHLVHLCNLGVRLRVFQIQYCIYGFH